MLPYHSAQQVHAALSWPTLVSALRDAFATGATVPRRHAHALSEQDSLLLMPAWSDEALGVKVVTVMPDSRAARTVQALYLLLDLLREMGQELDVRQDSVRITSRPVKPVTVSTEPYPGFPTDLHPVSTVVEKGNRTRSSQSLLKFFDGFEHVLTTSITNHLHSKPYFLQYLPQALRIRQRIPQPRKVRIFSIRNQQRLLRRRGVSHGRKKQ